MINKKTNDFLNQLYTLINNSGLPPVNVRLALDFMRMQVADLERKAIAEEQEAEKKRQQEKQEKKEAMAVEGA